MKECLECQCDEYMDCRCCYECDNIKECKGSCEFVKNGNNIQNCALMIDK